MAVRLFLGISLVIWTGYGFYCFFVPASLETGAGILAMTPAGTAELRAMYGGLQIAIGLLAGAGLVYASLRRTALVALTFLTGGLAIARLIGAGPRRRFWRLHQCCVGLRIRLDGDFTRSVDAFRVVRGTSLSFAPPAAHASPLLLCSEVLRP